ncbi:hypothetical protein AGLY_008268 [Aphis glycines]|uniref:Uncharacterized protein n=1 Tax=Aphis glycines TaxID=307491 RepID=A0A6G0TNL4_APHGL|nr:hypothetical protein AGLY_008268 [Aphis glycines]
MHPCDLLVLEICNCLVPQWWILYRMSKAAFFVSSHFDSFCRGIDRQSILSVLRWIFHMIRYYLLSSDTNVLVGINTMCVNKKSSRHGSFLELATFVLLSLCSSRCSKIFCGVPAIIIYLIFAFVQRFYNAFGVRFHADRTLHDHDELQTPQQMPVPVSPNLADEREPSARLTPQISALSPRARRCASGPLWISSCNASSRCSSASATSCMVGVFRAPSLSCQKLFISQSISSLPEAHLRTTDRPPPVFRSLSTRAYYPTGSGHWHTRVLRKRNDYDTLRNSECMGKCIYIQSYEYNPLCRLHQTIEVIHRVCSPLFYSLYSYSTSIQINKNHICKYFDFFLEFKESYGGVVYCKIENKMYLFLKCKCTYTSNFKYKITKIIIIVHEDRFRRHKYYDVLKIITMKDN